MIDLKGKVVVITGASSGIGKAMALHAADKGAITCLVGRNLARLEAVAAVAAHKAMGVCPYRCDLTSEKDIADLAAGIIAQWERVDVLIHSAAVITLDNFSSSRVDDLDEHYRTNLRAPFLLTQALLPALKRNQGQIVFLNSSVWLNPGVLAGQYTATKYALKAMTDSLRAEVNPDGVRVLSVYPGQTNTPMQQTLYNRLGKTYRPERLLQPEDVATIVMQALILPRTAEVTDIHIRPMLKS